MYVASLKALCLFLSVHTLILYHPLNTWIKSQDEFLFSIYASLNRMVYKHVYKSELSHQIIIPHTLHLYKL